jgi:hypothetical protein
MKRVIVLAPVAALILLLAIALPASSDPLTLDQGTWTERDPSAAKKSFSFNELKEQTKTAAHKISATLQAFVRTALTVVKVIVSTLFTIVVSVGKLVLRAALSLVLLLARWMLGVII